ncbi:MAG: cyclodeaminase/cyclohydrolase family protein [Clostridiales bacterium]|nr:cyclodeaminase/cyclohydrolase family protein [Clostridiales bacterium]
MKDYRIEDFIDVLNSDAPTPGGGGASALAGALSAALCGMVACLTTGKKKYAEYQDEIDEIIAATKALCVKMEDLIEEDAKAFGPLAKAYGIPKDEPGRDEVLENALVAAAEPPYRIVETAGEVRDIIVRLADIGSRLAISDVGVAAALCSATAKGAAMNVYINTKLMADRKTAERVNEDTRDLVRSICSDCDAVYNRIKGDLQS